VFAHRRKTQKRKGGKIWLETFKKIERGGSSAQTKKVVESSIQHRERISIKNSPSTGEQVKLAAQGNEANRRKRRKSDWGSTRLVGGGGEEIKNRDHAASRSWGLLLSPFSPWRLSIKQNGCWFKEMWAVDNDLFRRRQTSEYLTQMCIGKKTGGRRSKPSYLQSGQGHKLLTFPPEKVKNHEVDDSVIGSGDILILGVNTVTGFFLGVCPTVLGVLV